MNYAFVRLLSSFLLPCTLHAQNLITNGSFELGNFGTPPSGFNVLSPGSTAITGWSVITSEVGWGQNGNAFGVAAQNGTRLIDLTDLNDIAPYGALKQTIATTPGTVYRLSFYIGTEQSTPAYRGPATVSAATGGISASKTFNPGGTSGNQWGLFTLDFTAVAAATDITLQGIASGGGQYIGLDNVEVVSIDKDGDGMPDEYEQANGLNPQAAADRDEDADKDGQTNYQEYLAGTLPNDAGSVLRITSVQKAGTMLTLTWTSVPGRTYRIDRSGDLSGWTDTGTLHAAAAAPAVLTTATVNADSTGTAAKSFLRARAAAP